jgi:hypothetical protein
MHGQQILASSGYGPLLVYRYVYRSVHVSIGNAHQTL